MDSRSTATSGVTAKRNKSLRGKRSRRYYSLNRRGGYLYVAVLFTSLIVAGAVVTAVSLDTSRIKTQNAATDRESALRLAETELHRVSVYLGTEPEWRQNITAGVVSEWLRYGSLMGSSTATARFSANDEDGDLADDVFDETQIIAHAQYGIAAAAVSVVLETGYAPLELLKYGVSAFDDLQCENGATLVSERPIEVFDDCRTDSSGFITTSMLECSGSINLALRGDLAAGAVQVPGFNVVARYRDVGTEIPLNRLPIINGSRAISFALVSATANPYGVTDPHGIYWIDAQGQPLTIANSRLVATIAVMDASRVYVTGALSWEAPIGEGVMLVSDSQLEFDAVESTLNEAALGINFNPPTSPYRGFDSNLSTADRYPSEFRGIVYTSADLIVRPTFDGTPLTFTGALMSHDMTIYHDVFVRSYDEVLTQVPRGFGDPSKLRFKSGSFRRVDSI